MRPQPLTRKRSQSLLPLPSWSVRPPAGRWIVGCIHGSGHLRKARGHPAHIGSGGGGGVGRATFQDLSIVHKIDKASPQLLQACATGAHLKEATITFRKAGKGQQDFLIIKMNDVIITGVVQSAPSSETGSETVSLEFAKVDWEFKPVKADGSLDAGIHFKFDINANKTG